MAAPVGLQETQHLAYTLLDFGWAIPTALTKPGIEADPNPPLSFSRRPGEYLELGGEFPGCGDQGEAMCDPLDLAIGILGAVLVDEHPHLFFEVGAEPVLLVDKRL